MRSITWMVTVCCIFACILISAAARALEPENGLAGRLIVGYQGWFGCPGDFEHNKNWQHWFAKDVKPENFTVDLLPSVRGINPEDLCDTGLRKPDGSAVRLYSAQNERVVATHFRWMQEHGIDGAAAQRFVAELQNPESKRRSDHVVSNVRSASALSDRIFYVTYDVSGANPRTVTNDIRSDWRHLVDDLKITASRNYLHDHGKPVLQLWGFGFGDRPGESDEVGALIDDLKDGRDGLQPVTLIGGVPTNWRTLSGDSKSAPGWAKVYRRYDVISPWTVGRFANDQEADAFAKNYVIPDLVEARRSGVRYQPVIFPGFSWYNLMINRGESKYAILNQTRRNCGKFLWRQVSNLLDAHVNMMYVAMFDEVDEGTALFPLGTRSSQVPIGSRMVTLDQDGCTLPDDWYLRVTGLAAKYLRNNMVPPQQLEAVLLP